MFDSFPTRSDAIAGVQPIPWVSRLLSQADDLLQRRRPGGPVPRDGVSLGALFESLVVQTVRVLAQAHDAKAWHLRTQGGRREIDLIVEPKLGQVVALEAKLSATVDDHDTRHLRWFKAQLGENPLDAAVTTTGAYAYRRPDGVTPFSTIRRGCEGLSQGRFQVARLGSSHGRAERIDA